MSHSGLAALRLFAAHSPGPPAGASLLLILVLAYATWRVIKKRSRRKNDGEPIPIVFKKQKPTAPRLLKVLPALAALAFFLVLADAWLLPQRSFDVRALWAPRARLMDRSGQLLPDAVFDEHRLQADPRTPPLWPLLLGGGWLDSPLPAGLVSALAYLALLGVAWGVAARRGGRRGRLAWFLLAACPVFLIGDGATAAYSGAPEVWLALLFLVALAALDAWRKDPRPRWAALLGVSLTAAALTRNAGLALAAAALAPALWIALRDRERRAERLIHLGWIVALGGAPVYMWLRMMHELPPGPGGSLLTLIAEPGALAEGLRRLPGTFAELLGLTLFGFRLWGLLWVAALLALLLGGRRALRGTAALAAVQAGLYLALAVLIWSLAPDAPIRSAEGFLAASLLHAAPAAALFVARAEIQGSP